MERIIITQTKSTPRIVIDYVGGEIEFKGRSIVPEVDRFYQSIFYWLIRYVKRSNHKKTTVTFDIEYLNSYASKSFVSVLKILRDVRNELIVNWYYEEDDEDMLEKGEDYQDILHIKINLIEKKIDN